MRISDQQLSHFNTFGFLVFRQLLSPDEMTTYLRELNTGLDAWLPGRKHDRKQRHGARLMDAKLQTDEEQFAPGFQLGPVRYCFNELAADFGLDDFIASWN